MPSARRYSLVAIVLHWLSALGILALVAMGLAMTQLELAPMRKFELYQWHKSLGITVLLLTLLCLGWRLLRPPPALPPGMTKVERRAANGAHILLYGLLIGMPLTGWAVVSASPFNIPTLLYGTIPWPHLPVIATLVDKASAEKLLAVVHAGGAWILIALLMLHVGAALRHHFILRDDTLRRMLPLVARRPGAVR
ncbi:MAG: cytochrome b [Methylobacterium sp.]|uniref:cytochrome b n=1 Tax=Methylobacterium sp. TaxID=409 RepID=UPI0025F79CAC|nr:cytochrome b [Methylobacterium sp.]MBX9931695.1 cytochrome b [Methylobacterium sp.]